MRRARLCWTVSVGVLAVCSSVVSQTAEQTPPAKLASRWDTFKANVDAAQNEARLRFVALAAERDAQSLDANEFNERLAAFARTSPVWVSSWPLAAFARTPAVWFDSWDLVLSEPDAKKRSLKIDAALAARTRVLTTPDPTACFDKRSKYTPSSVCEGLLESWCWALFAARGTPSFRRADPDLAITREALGSVEELRTVEGSKSAPYGHDDVRFAFCSAAATSRKYDFGFVRYASFATPPFWRAYDTDHQPDSVSSEQFELSCGDRDRLKKLAGVLSNQVASVPRGRSRFHLEGWAYTVNRRLRQCISAVVNDCSNVYFPGGLPIISYLDASCRARDATEADLVADIKATSRFDTQATQPGQLALVDRLHACSSARANGYDWRYAKPNGGRCKPQPTNPRL